MEANPLVSIWSVHWQDMLLRGVIAILFGLLVFFWPGITVSVLVLLFGAFAFIDGVILVLQSVTGHQRAARWWARLVQGLISISAGILVFIWPGITLIAVVYIIAFYAILGGTLQIVSAIEMRKVIKGELLLIVSGILSVIIGVLLALQPLIGALALAQVIGIFAIAYGIMVAALGLRLMYAAHKPAPAQA
jgi:uncharacterized membrane protein HdeD (DUF308 family)